MPPTLEQRLERPELDPTTAMILRAMAQAGSPGTAAVSRETLEQALGQPLPDAGPATLGDRLGALGSFAGNAVMGGGRLLPPQRPAAPWWRAATPEEFVAARGQSTRGGFLTQGGPEELARHKLSTRYGGRVGVAVDETGDLQNLFNVGGPKGITDQAMRLAITKQGARTLDAFDVQRGSLSGLPKLYSKFGFVETGRMKFDPRYAPAGWDYEKYGTPDVVFMTWKGWPKNAAKAVRERVRSTRYFTDYDEAKNLSRREAAP